MISLMTIKPERFNLFKRLLFGSFCFVISLPTVRRDLLLEQKEKGD